MNSTQIECFLLLAQTHSFTRTAAQLYLSQQAVSKCISALENELGVILFDRSGPEVELTRDGRCYHGVISSAQGRLSYLKQEIAVHYSRLNRQLKVGCSDWVNPFGELEEALLRFRQNHSATRIEIVQLTNQELTQALLKRELDAAFFSEAQAPQSRELASRPVGQGEICLFASTEVIISPSDAEIKRCWGAPLLVVPSWDWSYLEQKVIGSRDQNSFQLEPEEVKVLPNVQSLMAQLQMGRYTAIGEARFGVLSGMAGLERVTLNTADALMCVWHPLSEHPLLEEFICQMEKALEQEDRP